MQIDPRHLIQLACIVQSGSFAAAAAKLGLAQPALSKNMKKLEDRLGAPIFERIGRQSVPTELGSTFARFGLMMLAADEQARAYAQHVATGQAGSLLLGTPPSLADNVLAPILAGFLATHVDCHVVCRKGHALTRQPQILPQHLEAQRWVAQSRGSDLRMQTEDGLARFGVRTYDIALDTDSTEAAYKAVARSDLITVMPRLPTVLSDHSDAIEFLPLDSTAFQRPIGIIQRASHTRSGLETAFLRHLKKEVQARENAT